MNRACFPQEKHQKSQKRAKFMNFSFLSFFWFGLLGRLLKTASSLQQRPFFLFLNEGNCAAMEQQKLSCSNYCLAAFRCLSGPLGRGFQPSQIKRGPQKMTLELLQGVQGQPKESFKAIFRNGLTRLILTSEVKNKLWMAIFNLVQSRFWGMGIRRSTFQ